MSSRVDYFTTTPLQNSSSTPPNNVDTSSTILVTVRSTGARKSCIRTYDEEGAKLNISLIGEL